MQTTAARTASIHRAESWSRATERPPKSGMATRRAPVHKHQNRGAVVFVVCHGDMSRNVGVEIRRVFTAILADPLGLGESQMTGL